MSKEDKAAEMARRREERKQVSCRTECCWVSTDDLYTENCATEGAEEGCHLTERVALARSPAIAVVAVSAVLVILFMIRLSHDLKMQTFDGGQPHSEDHDLFPYTEVVL